MVNKFIIKSARASRRIRPNKGRILHVRAFGKNKVSFSLLVFAFLLSLDRSLLRIQMASNKENQKIDAVTACEIF